MNLKRVIFLNVLALAIAAITGIFYSYAETKGLSPLDISLLTGFPGY